MAIAGVDPRSDTSSLSASSPSSIFLTPTAFKAVRNKKTPIILGGVCPLAWATTDKFHKQISRYLSITTHTPPKTTGVVTACGLSRMPLLTNLVYINLNQHAQQMRWLLATTQAIQASN